MARSWRMNSRKLACAGLGVLSLSYLASATEPAKNPSGAVRLVAQEEKKAPGDVPKKPTMAPMAPEVDLPSTAPPSRAPETDITPAPRASSPLSGPGQTPADLGLTGDRLTTAGTTSANVVPGSDAVGRAATDAGDLLGRSTSAVGVETQKRSPIANEARIRGYRLAEITTHADGAFWFPARLDLDTFLSKIDSGNIQDIIVIKGPYSARYGPGFSFIDIATLATPRHYDEPFKWEGRTFSTYKLNGEQLYGRQSFWGGSSDWGFRLSYGHRTGNDYKTGDGTDIPASFNARDVDFAYGYDFSPVSRLEIGYMRLDQTGLEFPGQIFDTRFLVTDGVRLRYVLEQQQYFDRFVMDGWYNYTRLAGDNFGEGKRRQIPELRGTPGLNNPFLGRTDIDLGSVGYRMAMTWGESKHPQLTVGTDLRRLNGHLNEFDSVLIESFGNVLPCGNDINFPVPRSHQNVIGGLFVEYVHPYQDRLVVKVGARGDYAHQDIDKKPPPGFTCEGFQDIAQALLGTRTDFEREFGLWLAYGTAEYKLTDHWTAVGGLGHAERPPTTTELYALEPFLAILQQGFTSVRGNVGLDPERLWQIDAGLRADYQYFRAGFNAFCSFIQDYITYAAVGRGQKGIGFGSLGTNALAVQFVNTDLATLAGFEIYTEFDYSEYLTPFMTMSYVQGRDHSRSGRGVTNLGPGIGGLGNNQEPLPGIPPLDARMGLRFHEARPQPRWGLELAGRFVASQERVASSLGETRSSGFAIYDVRSFWKARQGLTLTAGVENVFDRNYREHLDLRTGLGVFQPGVNGYFGVEMRY